MTDFTQSTYGACHYERQGMKTSTGANQQGRSFHQINLPKIRGEYVGAQLDIKVYSTTIKSDRTGVWWIGCYKSDDTTWDEASSWATLQGLSFPGTAEYIAVISPPDLTGNQHILFDLTSCIAPYYDDPLTAAHNPGTVTILLDHFGVTEDAFATLPADFKFAWDDGSGKDERDTVNWYDRTSAQGAKITVFFKPYGRSSPGGV